MKTGYNYFDPCNQSELRVVTNGAGASYVTTVSSGVNIPMEDAPAVALAILEAAGWTSPIFTTSNAEGAVNLLRVHVKQAAEALAKAEDEAKLDAEADALRMAIRDNTQNNVWACLTDAARIYWRTLALKARELHASREEAA